MTIQDIIKADYIILKRGGEVLGCAMDQGDAYFQYTNRLLSNLASTELTHDQLEHILGVGLIRKGSLGWDELLVANFNEVYRGKNASNYYPKKLNFKTEEDLINFLNKNE